MKPSNCNRITVSIVAIGCALSLAACGSSAAPGTNAAAAKYPTKTITMIVPQAAGSASDILARSFAQSLGTALHVPVEVKDLPGGSDSIALAALQGQPADGYTVFFPSESLLYGLAQHLSPYTTSDLTFLARLVEYPMGLYVSTTGSFSTIQGLVQYAKSHPGAVSVSASGAVSAGEQIVANLESAYNIKLNYVAVNGGNAAALAVLSGQSMMGSGVLTNAIPYVKSGKMKVIYVSASSADPTFPSAPTASSLRINDVVGNWLGLVLKKGTPSAVADKLVSAADKVAHSSSWLALVKKQNIAASWAGASTFTAQVTRQYPTISSYVSSVKKAK